MNNIPNPNNILVNAGYIYIFFSQPSPLLINIELYKIPKYFLSGMLLKKYAVNLSF